MLSGLARRLNSSGLLLKVLLVSQLISLGLIWLLTRTPYIWILVVFSYFPTVVICLLAGSKKSSVYVLISIVLLFVCQHAVFVFSQPLWGYSYQSDSINDLHLASVISEEKHFEFGATGYSHRVEYSYYPMLHLFSVLLSQISGLNLSLIAVLFIPFLNATLVPILLYYLFGDFFGLEREARNFAVLIFSLSFYYAFFYSQFVREVYAFPLVLLCILIFVKNLREPKREYAILLPIIFLVVVMAHHISSYVLYAILALITVGANISHRNRNSNMTFLFMSTILIAYTAFVTLDFTFNQVEAASRGFLAIFEHESFSAMKTYSSGSQYLAYASYGIIGIASLIGGIRFLKVEKARRYYDVFLATLFFGLAFVLSVALRLSTSANQSSWTYYMALRGTIWAFIGIAVCSAVFLQSFLKRKRWKIFKWVMIIFLFSILAAGKFAQYPRIISDPSIPPRVSYQQYVSALWLKNETIHGSLMLIAPPSEDNDAYETARSMAPYAYLRERFINEFFSFDDFTGYIPFVGEFYDQYRNNTSVNIIYSNGGVQIGYKAPPS